MSMYFEAKTIMPSTAWRLSALHCVQINGVEFCLQVFCLGYENTSARRETGAELFDIIRKIILDFEAKHNLEVVGFTTDGASNCRLCRRLLMEWRPRLITMDCCAHMVCTSKHACCCYGHILVLAITYVMIMTQ